MGKVIAKKVVERKHGYLYYVDGQGNVCEAKMARGGRKKKAAKKKTTTKRKATTRKKATTRRKR
tara:strand:+ start:1820 stop:2011 length:192 start_codon:yes stop_codon:yes gene_type:complete